MILMDVRRLMEPLTIWEGALWLLIPALAQWLILQRTEENMRGMRMLLLAPVCWVLYSIVGAVLMMVFFAFLILGLFSLLFQDDFLSTAVLGSLKLLGMLLTSETVLNAFIRLGLCVAGWGLGWAAHSLLNCGRGDGYV